MNKIFPIVSAIVITTFNKNKKQVHWVTAEGNSTPEVETSYGFLLKLVNTIAETIGNLRSYP